MCSCVVVLPLCLLKYIHSYIESFPTHQTKVRLGQPRGRCVKKTILNFADTYVYNKKNFMSWLLTMMNWNVLSICVFGDLWLWTLDKITNSYHFFFFRIISNYNLLSFFCAALLQQYTQWDLCHPVLCLDVIQGKGHFAS